MALPIENLRRGSSGDFVQVVQRVLNLYRAPSAALVPDGKFGPLTESAVIEFQRRFGLVADGIIGPLSRARLFALGTYQLVCVVTSQSDTPERARPGGGGAQLNFAIPGGLLGQAAPPAPQPFPPIIPPARISFPPTVTQVLPPAPPNGSVITDLIPGLTDPLPFPNLTPSVVPAIPPLPPLTLPSFFPQKVQLSPGIQRAVPKLTLLGNPPSTNPVTDVFVFTVRGVWSVGKGQVQAGGTLGLPITQPISDRKNTTYQVFAQGLSPDLLIASRSFAHLFLIGKASVTVPKDRSSTSAALSAQFKASFDLTEDGKVTFSVVGGPQITATARGGSPLQLTLTPFVLTAGATVTIP